MLLTNGPQDRPAVGVRRPAQSDPNQSAEVIFADGDAAQGTSTAKGRKRGRVRPRKQICRVPKVVLPRLLLLNSLWVDLKSKSSVL